jgi:4-alpha-glucanotransferase
VGFHAYLQWLAEDQLALARNRARELGVTVRLYLGLALGVEPVGPDTRQPRRPGGGGEMQNLPDTLDEHPNWRRKCRTPVEDWGASERARRIADGIRREGRTTDPRL